jgi:glycosyltransferase involved in cell wall biosynthesis
MDAFPGELDELLKGFPDNNEPDAVERIRGKSALLYLGMDFSKLYSVPGALSDNNNSAPLILWNHRWEYDKGPEEFFKALYLLKDKGLAFKVAILGEHFEKIPKLFEEARVALGERVIHFGYAEDFSEYARFLKSADILPVTSEHDFFGSSVVEAIYCGVSPLLPKRLAYPEHIPATLHDRYLYDGFSDFMERLEALLKSIEAGQPRGSNGVSNEALRGHVLRYGWENMAPIYDEAMEDVVASGGQ